MQNQILDNYGNPIKSVPRFHRVADKTRLTRDQDLPITGTGLAGIVAPTDEADWKLRSFTEEQLALMEFHEIIDVLVQSSPQLTRALADLRMHVNTQWTLTVAEDDPAAEAILAAAVDQMRMEIGEPIAVKLDKLVASGFLKGAFYLETIFENTEFLDIRINDPLRVRFEHTENPERGQHYVRGEMQNGVFVPIPAPTVQYLPLNSLDNSPLGRSMIGSAIFPIVSLLGMMKSVRQMVDTQAYPYQLATIDRKQLTDAGLTAQSGALAAEMERVETDIREQFEKAQRGTQFVFGREVDVEIIGALSRRNLDGIEMLEKIWKEMIIQALQQYPVIVGLAEGNALSTNAEQQLEAWTSFTDSFQSKIEEVMTTAFTQVLREQGNGATVIFELKRNTSFVQRQRAERTKLKTESLSIWLADGVITRQEYRDAIRAPESFDRLDELFDPELPSELDALPMPGATPASLPAPQPDDGEEDDE